MGFSGAVKVILSLNSWKVSSPGKASLCVYDGCSSENHQQIRQMKPCMIILVNITKSSDSIHPKCAICGHFNLKVKAMGKVSYWYFRLLLDFRGQ